MSNDAIQDELLQESLKSIGRNYVQEQAFIPLIYCLAIKENVQTNDASICERDPISFATSFGYSGTYYDYVFEIAKERGGLNGLINFDITKDDISDILEESGFKGYRFDGALKWILKTIQIVKDLEKVQ